MQNENVVKKGKYEYKVVFEYIYNKTFWQDSFKRNQNHVKIKKMSLPRRKQFLNSKKPNVTVCNIYRRPVGSESEFSLYSVANSKRSAVDKFNEFFGKARSLDRALKSVCVDKKRPNKEFRKNIWNIFLKNNQN